MHNLDLDARITACIFSFLKMHSYSINFLSYLTKNLNTFYLGLGKKINNIAFTHLM